MPINVMVMAKKKKVVDFLSSMTVSSRRIGGVEVGTLSVLSSYAFREWWPSTISVVDYPAVTVDNTPLLGVLGNGVELSTRAVEMIDFFAVS